MEVMVAVAHSYVPGRNGRRSGEKRESGGGHCGSKGSSIWQTSKGRQMFWAVWQSKGQLIYRGSGAALSRYWLFKTITKMPPKYPAGSIPPAYQNPSKR